MRSFEKPLYDFSIRTFSKLADISKGTHSKLEKLVEGRKDLFEKLQQFRADFIKPIVWFHVASLGEFEQARPVITEFKKRMNDYGVVVSFSVHQAMMLSVKSRRKILISLPICHLIHLEMLLGFWIY